MKKLKIRTNLNYVHDTKRGEKNLLPSETVQGQSMSIKDMLIRFNNGSQIPTDQNLIWNEEEEETDFPLKLTDLTDLDEAASKLDALRQRVKKADQQVKDKQKAAKEAAKIPLTKEEDTTTTT